MESIACRLCLSSENLTYIFSDTGIEMKMSEIIREHFKFDISEADPLPNVVCSKCWSTTEAFHELFEKSKVVQKKFQNKLMTTEHDPIDGWPNFTKEIHIELIKIEDITVSGSDDDTPMDYEEKIDENCIDKIVNGNAKGNLDAEPNAREALGGLQRQSETTPVRVLRKRIKRTNQKETGQKTVRKHKEKTKSDEETKFIAENFDMKCDQCDVVFISLYEAQMHYRGVHNEPKGYVKCCGNRLKMDWQIRDHVKFHLNPDPFKCDTCDKSFTSSMLLVQHKRRHKLTMNKSFICDFCGSHFRDKEAISRHLFSKHVKSKPKFECGICLKKFHIRSLLKSHLLQVHRKKTLSKTCEICGKSFRTKGYLDEHMQTHSNESTRLAQMKQCEHCGEMLMTKSGVFYHKQLHTTGVQKCKECGMKLRNKLSLLAHIRTYHREHKFKCSFCDKTFAIGSELKKHEEFHTRHNVYLCKFCPKTYTVPASLQLNVRRNHYEENKSYKEKKKVNGSNV